jgi:hypothetical protein
VKTVKSAAGERFFFDGKFDVFYATEEGQKNSGARWHCVGNITGYILSSDFIVRGEFAGEIDTHMFSITLMEFIDLFSQSPIRHYVGN